MKITYIRDTEVLGREVREERRGMGRGEWGSRESRRSEDREDII